MRSTHTTQEHSLIGVGLYSLADAARYLNVGRPLVSHWSLGRPRRPVVPTEAELGRTPSVFIEPIIKVDGENVLTFAHLIELRMVKLFRNKGITMHTIKLVAHNISRVLGTTHPFSTVDLKTDGKTIFGSFTLSDIKDEISRNEIYKSESESVSDTVIMQDLSRLQYVMGDIVRLYLDDTDYDNRIASRWWLLGKDSDRAVLDPKVNFGQPTDAPTGVPLSAMYSLIRAGETVQSVADWYEVPIKAVEAAINFYNHYKFS